MVTARAHAPLDEVIQRVALSPGTAGRWLRLAGADELQVALAVPSCRVLATAQHLLSHGSLAEAEALNIFVCEELTCDLAAIWLADRADEVPAASDF